MNRLILLACGLASMCLLGGCATVHGMSQDISSAASYVGLPSVSKMLNGRPSGGLNTYDPGSGQSVN